VLGNLFAQPLRCQSWNVFVQFNVSDDEFQVTEGDFIGWTGEDNYRIVSRDAALPTCHDCSRTRYIPGDTMDFWLPKVRVEPYSDITPTARQFTFSAAVKIKRRKLHSVTPLVGVFLLRIVYNNYSHFSEKG